MRLSIKEQEDLINTLTPLLAHTQAELKLFGSRVNDDAKGGDIDLLLILPNDSIYTQLLEKKLNLLVEFKQKLGDQKIDLLLATSDMISSDPFLEMICENAVLMHRWG